MKMSKMLRFLPLIFIIFGSVAIITCFFLFHKEQRSFREQYDMLKLGYEFRSASDYLTDQAREYVQYGERKYMEAYFEEAETTRTREKVVQKLEEIGVSEEALTLINTAKQYSYELEEIEVEVFELVAKDQLEEARELMFNNTYWQKKQLIIDTLDLFQESLEKSYAANVKVTKIQVQTALSCVVLLVVSMVLATVISFKVLNRKIKGITEMAHIAGQISQGTMDLDFKQYESDDEFGMLAKGFNDILKTVYGIEHEIRVLVKGVEGVNLSYRADTGKYKGHWENILQGLNNAVQLIREQIIEKAPIAYILVKDDIIIDCNRYANRQLNMRPGDFIEKYYVDPAQRRAILSRWDKEGIADKELVNFWNSDGEERRYTLFVNIISNTAGRTVILWGVDMEEEERKNDFIRRSQNDLQILIDALPMAMIIQNPETKEIKYANVAFFTMMKIDLGENIADIRESFFYHIEQSGQKSARDKERSLLSAIGRRKSTAFAEITYQTTQDDIVETRVTASEILYDGEKCIVKMIQDISTEKLRTQLLLSAAEREKEANQLKSSFLANMSHEIRTPMNAIIGLTQIALMREQEAENVDIFRKINSSSRNLLNIINDILDFSKIEAQKLDITEDVFSLEDIVANAFMVAAERIEDKRIEMLLDMETDLPVTLFGDKTRMWQVLKNLLDNSAKYTEKGFIILKISVDKEEEDRIYITFSVEDTGIGMSPQQLDALFTPFSQFNSNYKYKTTGTGLGMSITKQLLGLMGGTIKVESELGVGTRMSVHISFKKTEDTQTLQDQMAECVSENYPILIGDEDAVSCEIMQRILESAGLSPVCVHTVDEVMEKAREQQENGTPFKVIILEASLGDSNGIEIGRKLKESSSSSELLLISAYVKEIPVSKAQAAGFRDVLQKPLLPSVFVKRVSDTLDNSGTVTKAEYRRFIDAKVLVCEDNPINQEIALEMLKMLGIYADVVGDGQECLKILEQKEYDLILMDIQMPVMDGKEATEQIRGSEKPYRDICILAMTANVMIEQISEFMEIGMNGHIPKPIEFDDLYEHLVKYLPEEKQGEASELNINTDADFSVEGINVKEGLSRFGGSEERYKKALLNFADEKNPYEEAEISDEFKRYMHTVKGVAGNLGITAIFELAKQVESNAKEGKIDSAKYQQFQDEFALIKEVIRKEVVMREEESETFEYVTEEEYLEDVRLLKEALGKFNPLESEELARKLMSVKRENAPNFAKVLASVEQYDFNRAAEYLNEKK